MPKPPTSVWPAWQKNWSFSQALGEKTRRSLELDEIRDRRMDERMIILRGGNIGLVNRTQISVRADKIFVAFFRLGFFTGRTYQRVVRVVVRRNTAAASRARAQTA